MRILIAGPIYHPEHREGNDLFPESQWPYFWVKALRELGHDVRAFYTNVNLLWGTRFSRAERAGPPGMVDSLIDFLPRFSPELRWRAQAFVDQAVEFRAELVWVMDGNRWLSPSTLKRIRRGTGAVLMLSGETSPVLFASPHEKQCASHYDLVITNDAYHALQWQEMGAPHTLALPISACDPDFHRPYELTEKEEAAYGAEIAFVGSLQPKSLYTKRIAALEALREYDLAIWSEDGVPESLEAHYRGGILGEDMMRVTVAAKIGLNPHPDHMLHGGNLRLFEMAGSGVFQITNDLPGVGAYLRDGREIVLYHSMDHLREQVDYYLAHPDQRRKIAQAAQQHAYAAHTYAQRMTRLTDIVNGIRDELRESRLARL